MRFQVPIVFTLVSALALTTAVPVPQAGDDSVLAGDFDDLSNYANDIPGASLERRAPSDNGSSDDKQQLKEEVDKVIKALGYPLSSLNIHKDTVHNNPDELTASADTSSLHRRSIPDVDLTEDVNGDDEYTDSLQTLERRQSSEGSYSSSGGYSSGGGYSGDGSSPSGGEDQGGLFHHIKEKAKGFVSKIFHPSQWFSSDDDEDKTQTQQTSYSNSNSQGSYDSSQTSPSQTSYQTSSQAQGTYKVRRSVHPHKFTPPEVQAIKDSISAQSNGNKLRRRRRSLETATAAAEEEKKVEVSASQQHNADADANANADADASTESIVKRSPMLPASLMPSLSTVTGGLTSRLTGGLTNRLTGGLTSRLTSGLTSRLPGSFTNAASRLGTMSRYFKNPTQALHNTIPINSKFSRMTQSMTYRPSTSVLK